MAHGSSDFGLCFTVLAKSLEDEYNFLIIDQRGHGFTDSPQSGYSAHNRAKDLHGLIDALQIRQPILLGHSMGGGTVLRFAHLWPNVRRAVVVEDSGLWGSGISATAASAPPRKPCPTAGAFSSATI